MSIQRLETTLQSVVHPIVTLLLIVGSSVLALMMFLTVVDVVGRYVFNLPIDGAFELTEFMMAIFVPFALVYCEKQKSHIVVDLLFERLPAVISTSIEIIILLLTTAFFAIIGWQSIFAMREEFTNSIKSTVLLISTYPFFLPLLIAFFLLAILLFVRLLNTLSTEKGN